MSTNARVTTFTALLFGGAVCVSVWASLPTGIVGVPASPGDWMAAVGILVSLTAAGVLQVEFRNGEDIEAVDLFEAALMPALLLFAGPVAVVMAVVAKAISQAILGVRAAKLRFNVAQWSFAVAVGSTVFLLTPGGSHGDASAIPALLISMVVVITLNHLSVIGVLSLVERRSCAAVLADLRSLILPVWILGGGANLALGLMFAAMAAWAPAVVAVALVPLALFDAAHRASTTARTDRARLASLHRATAALSKLVEPLEALPAVLAEVRSCFSCDAALVLLEDVAGVAEMEVGTRPLAEAVVNHDVSGRLRAEDPRWTRVLQAAGHRHALVAQIRQQGRTVGVLLALDPRGADGSEEAETAVLAAFASEVASALARSEAIASVMAERRLLAEVFDTASDGVCAIGADDEIVTWNAAMEALTGFGADELRTATSLQALNPTGEDGAPVRFTVAEAPDPVAAVAAMPEEVRIRNRLGEELWIGCSYALAPSGVGKATPMLVITARDVTVARERARLKDEFVAIASHELRTPATVVTGMAHALMLAGDSMTEVQRRKAIAAIHRSATRLGRVVANVLAVTGVERGNPDDMDAFDLGAVCNDAFIDITDEHPESADWITLDPGLTGLWARGRDSAVHQILVNLLGNAVKYGDGQPINLRADRTDTTVSLVVADQGPGIPRHEHERIFERFARLHQHNMQAGTGLGLYVARELAVSMGGSLRIDSEPGRGTTFILELLCPVGDSSLSTSASPPSPEPPASPSTSATPSRAEPPATPEPAGPSEEELRRMAAVLGDLPTTG